MPLAELSQILGNFGEFVGAIAVVVTLVYIAIQVSHGRQEVEANRIAMEENTRIQKAASLDSFNNAFSRFRSHIINSDDVARIWIEGKAGRLTSETDRERFIELSMELIVTNFAGYERAVAVANAPQVEKILQISLSMLRMHPGFHAVWNFWSSSMESKRPRGHYIEEVEELLRSTSTRTDDSPP